MKILIYGMSNIHGGVESFIMNYFRNFSEDIKVDFVTDFSSIPFQTEILSRGSKIFHLPSRKKNYFAYRKKINKIFEDGSYDAVWSNVCSLSTIDILVAAKKYEVGKRIIHSHNSENMGGFITNLLHNTNKRRLNKYASDYWACSTHAGEWMFGDLSDKVEIINNAINTKDYIYNPEIRNYYRKKLGFTDEHLVIGNVGRFHDQKNHFFLIEIFREIIIINKNAKLVLVGSGSHEQEIKMKIKEYSLQDKISILGQRDDVNNLMQAFDMFLLPSKYEGLPFVLVEAQASGLPSFTSDNVVSPQSKVTDLLTFISLDLSPSKWANIILKVDRTRKGMLKEIEDSGFDIKMQSSIVERKLGELNEKN